MKSLFVFLFVLVVLSGCSKDEDPIAVSSLEVTPSSVELMVGEIKQLALTIMPENAEVETVVWTTTDVNVVIVNSMGEVLGVGAGETTVNVRAGGKKASCAVKVKAIAQDEVD